MTFGWVNVFTGTSSLDADPGLPYSGSETLSPQAAINKSMGYGSTPYFLAAGQSSSIDDFYAVYVLNQAVLSGLTIQGSYSASNAVGITLDAGTPIYGTKISGVGVASGVVVCYR